MPRRRARYDQLTDINPISIVQLNRAIAITALDDPDVALALASQLDVPLHGTDLQQIGIDPGVQRRARP